MTFTSQADQSRYQTESSDTTSGSNGQRPSLQSQLTSRRSKLNHFLAASGRGTVMQPKKNWENASMRTRKSRITTAKDVVVSSSEVIAPDDPGSLWLGLLSSQSVEESLGLPSSQEEKQYLRALAESYDNAQRRDTRTQILSIMADLAPSSIIKEHVRGVTDYRIKEARKHRWKYGRGVPIDPTRSPRMRVDELQLDHFLAFITSPHINLDLPFGQRYLHLSNGKILETPNVIRSMIPQRIADQYKQHCFETNFTPFSKSTMLRILSCCSASVRKSLQGLDYFTAEGGKGIDDLVSIAEKLGEGGMSKKWVQSTSEQLKRGKQYLKSDFKVRIKKRRNNTLVFIFYFLLLSYMLPMSQAFQTIADVML